MFVDGIRYRVRENGCGKEVSCYIIIGVNINGNKEFVGNWIADDESASQWANIFNEIKALGVERILMLTADNLRGISEAIKATYPQTIIQKCVVHQMRNSLRFVATKDKPAFCADMKAIYRSATAASTLAAAFKKFKHEWDNKYHYAIKLWEKNFDELTSFYELPFEVRKMIYTTNVIENVNSQLRRATKTNKTKGSLINVEALDKIIYLKLLAIEEKWTKKVHNWGQIINQLDIKFNLKKYF